MIHRFKPIIIYRYMYKIGRFDKKIYYCTFKFLNVFLDRKDLDYNGLIYPEIKKKNR